MADDLTPARLAELRALLPVLDDALSVATATVGAGHRARFAAVRPLVDMLPTLLDAAAERDRLAAALREANDWFDTFRRMSTKDETWDMANGGYLERVHAVIRDAIGNDLAPQARGIAHEGDA